MNYSEKENELFSKKRKEDEGYEIHHTFFPATLG